MGRFSEGFDASEMFDKEIQAVMKDKAIPVYKQEELKALNDEITSKINNAETAIEVTKVLVKVAKMFL